MRRAGSEAGSGWTRILFSVGTNGAECTCIVPGAQRSCARARPCTDSGSAPRPHLLDSSRPSRKTAGEADSESCTVAGICRGPGAPLPDPPPQTARGRENSSRAAEEAWPPGPSAAYPKNVIPRERLTALVRGECLRATGESTHPCRRIVPVQDLSRSISLPHAVCGGGSGRGALRPHTSPCQRAGNSMSVLLGLHPRPARRRLPPTHIIRILRTGRSRRALPSKHLRDPCETAILFSVGTIPPAASSLSGDPGTRP
jgi:hypothetical protein